MATEYRHQYQSLTAANLSLGRAKALQQEHGTHVTSSRVGLPWPPQETPMSVMWRSTAWMPSTVPSAHYRPSSADFGATIETDVHRHKGRFGVPPPSSKVRYLQAPYLSGSLKEGAGLDYRPTTSVSTHTMSSERERDMLLAAHHALHDRMGQSMAWTAARAQRSQPISAIPDAYMTITNDSYRPRPAADAQQHRLNTILTSSLATSNTLESEPRPVTAPALGAGSGALHSTRYLGIRASDGGRQLLDVTVA